LEIINSCQEKTVEIKFDRKYFNIISYIFSERVRARVCVCVCVCTWSTHFLSRFMVQQKSSACERKLWCQTKATFL